MPSLLCGNFIGPNFFWSKSFLEKTCFWPDFFRARTFLDQFVTTPTQPQLKSWVWHENDFTPHTHQPPPQKTITIKRTPKATFHLLLTRFWIKVSWIKQQQKQQHHYSHHQHQQQQKNKENNKYISAITDPILNKLEIITHATETKAITTKKTITNNNNKFQLLALQRSWRCPLHTRATSPEPLPETCVLANHIARKMRPSRHHYIRTPGHRNVPGF